MNLNEHLINAKAGLSGLFESLMEEARRNPRLRSNVLLRSSNETGSPAFMVNALLPGTYVRPHKHIDGQEIIIPTHGSARLMLFHENGRVKYNRNLVSGGNSEETYLGVIEKGEYHTLIVPRNSPGVVVMEFFGAVYKPKSYKTFPDWAPLEEDSQSAREYLEKLGNEAELLIRQR